MVNIKPLWCHVITMECLKPFSRHFFQSGRAGGGWIALVKSILSAKQLVTLKFDTSAICFLLSGETIFFLKFKAVSNIPSFLSIFFESQGGQWTAKGALRSSQIGLLNKRTATTTRYLGNILVKWNVINSKRNQEIVTKTVWVLPFYDYNTINVKGIEEIFTDIAIWIICESNTRWKVIRERFVALLGKFHVVAKNVGKF